MSRLKCGNFFGSNTAVRQVRRLGEAFAWVVDRSLLATSNTSYNPISLIRRVISFRGVMFSVILRTID